jgi:hypothetical protein
MEEERRFRSTFVTGDLSPVSPAAENKIPQGQFFHIRQLSSSTTEDGGQLLDCRLGTDEETGLQQVEMVFSLNPFGSDKLATRDLLSDSIPNTLASGLIASDVAYSTTNHAEHEVNVTDTSSNIHTSNDLGFYSHDASEDSADAVFYCNSSPSACFSSSARDSNESSVRTSEQYLGDRRQQQNNEENIQSKSFGKSDLTKENKYLARHETDVSTQSSKTTSSERHPDCQLRIKGSLVRCRKQIVDLVEILQLNQSNRWMISLALIIILAFLISSGVLRLTNSSTVTSLAVIGLCVGLAEFYWTNIFSRLCTLHLRPGREWSLRDEALFDHCCSVLACIWVTVTESITELQSLRHNKSILGYATAMLSLMVVSWLSTKLDALFLVYSLLAAVCMVFGFNGQRRIEL